MKTDLGDHEGVQGTNLYVSCAADGFPTPSYKFFKVRADQYHNNNNIIEFI